MNFVYNNYLNLRKVTFSNINNIILIPSNNDYKEYNLIYELWYSEKDYNKFKDDFINEVNNLYKLYPTITIDEIKHKIYNVSSNDCS